MTDVVGNPEEERRAEFYHEPWSQEAVSRYFYCKVRKRQLRAAYAPVALPLDVWMMYSWFSFYVSHNRSSRGDRSWNRP